MGDLNCMIRMEHVQCSLLLMHKLEKHERGNISMMFWCHYHARMECEPKITN